MYKVVEWSEDGRPGTRAELLDVFRVTAPEPVRRMVISRRVSDGTGTAEWGGWALGLVLGVGYTGAGTGSGIHRGCYGDGTFQE